MTPTTHIGNPPRGAIKTAVLDTTTAIAVVLIAVGFTTFRHRECSQG